VVKEWATFTIHFVDRDTPSKDGLKRPENIATNAFAFECRYVCNSLGVGLSFAKPHSNSTTINMTASVVRGPELLRNCYQFLF